MPETATAFELPNPLALSLAGGGQENINACWEYIAEGQYASTRAQRALEAAEALSTNKNSCIYDAAMFVSVASVYASIKNLD